MTIRFHWDPPEGPPNRDEWEHTAYGALCWWVGQEEKARYLLLPPSSCDVHMRKMGSLWTVHVENVVPPKEEHVPEPVPDFSSEILESLRRKGKPVLEAVVHAGSPPRDGPKLAPYRLESFAWERFSSGLSRLKTAQEVLNFIYDTWPRDNRTARYYANLSVLVYTCAVPDDSTVEERQLYLELVRQWKKHSPYMFARGSLELLEEALVSSLGSLSLEGMIEREV